MSEIEDRLIPRDGLNNFNVTLARMDLPTNGSARFSFAVTDTMLPAAEFQVSVPATGQGLDRMTVEAHDALIDILRQLMFRADKARVVHVRQAARVVVVAAPADQTGLPGSDGGAFGVERRGAADRRVNDLM